MTSTVSLGARFAAAQTPAAPRAPAPSGFGVVRVSVADERGQPVANARVDFSAAGQILNSLAPLASRQVELHNVNHLVAVMLHALGLQHVARILPRKH